MTLDDFWSVVVFFLTTAALIYGLSRLITWTARKSGRKFDTDYVDDLGSVIAGMLLAFVVFLFIIQIALWAAGLVE